MPERQDPVFDTPAGAPAAAPAAPEHRPRRRRRGWLGLALLLVLATGLASLWWWSGREQHPWRKPWPWHSAGCLRACSLR